MLEIVRGWSARIDRLELCALCCSVKATKPKPASELIAKPSAPAKGNKLVLVKPSVNKAEVPSLTETAMGKSTDTSRSTKVELSDDDAQVTPTCRADRRFDRNAHACRRCTVSPERCSSANSAKDLT